MSFYKPITLLALIALFAPSFSQETQAPQAPLPAPVPGSPDPAMPSSQAKPILTGPKVVNRVAAKVNGRAVTSNEVSVHLRQIIGPLQAQYPRQGPEFMKQLVKAKNTIIDNLIDRELLLGEFEEKGFIFPTVYIDQEIERVIREQFGGDRELFLDALRLDGMTIREYREMKRRELIVMSMRSQKYDMDIPPTPEEVRQEYNRSKSNYRDVTQDKIVFEKIFIPVGAPGTEDGDFEVQLKFTEIILQKIKDKEESFADMAKAYSRDAHAADGGQWPPLTRSELSADFAVILFDAELNTLVGPIGDRFGFTIVRVQKKIQAPAPPLSKVKSLVEDQVRRNKSAIRYDRWIKRLRETAVIKKYM